MPHLTSGVEYGLHCLLWLVDAGVGQPSTRDLSELQGVSPSFVAKIFPKLEKAGIVSGAEGVHGGYRLARPPSEITVLDVVDAIEGDKPLFECREVRDRCAVFGDSAPRWATQGVCSIHAVMLRAEAAMRESLAEETLAGLAARVGRKAPRRFSEDIRGWLHERQLGRGAKNSAPHGGRE